MYSVTYPNGQVLNSSALTPKDIETIFQILVLQLLGITVDPKNPETAYRQVRLGWQQSGSPAWTINENDVIITSYPENDPYSQVRDQLLEYDSTSNILQNMSYTQVWKMHFTIYGTDCINIANKIITGMQLDWVYEFLKNPPAPYTNTLYLIPVFNRPVFIPEDFQGKWWARADVDLKFNELVLENIVAPAGEYVGIEVITDAGETRYVDVET